MEGYEGKVGRWRKISKERRWVPEEGGRGREREKDIEGGKDEEGVREREKTRGRGIRSQLARATCI